MTTTTSTTDPGSPEPGRPDGTTTDGGSPEAGGPEGGGPDAGGGLALALGHGERVVLGREVERLRQAADLTLTALAGTAGISVAVLRRYERGGTGPVDLRVLRVIATALGTTAGALIDAMPATRPPAARSGPVVLLPTRHLTAGPRAGALWRLVQYVPRPLGQRWDHPHPTDPTTLAAVAGPGDPASRDRDISPAVLDWASALFGYPVQTQGPAIELTGTRSWYLGRRHP